MGRATDLEWSRDDARGAAPQGASQRRRPPRRDRAARRAGLLPDRAGDLRPAPRLRPPGRHRERLPRARAAHLGGLRPADRPRLRHLALRAGPLRRRPSSPSRLRQLRQGRGVRGSASSRRRSTGSRRRRATRSPATTSCCTAPAATAASRSLAPGRRERRDVDRDRDADDRAARRQRRDQVGERDADPDRGERERRPRARGRARGSPSAGARRRPGRRSARAGAARRPPGSPRRRRSRAGRGTPRRATPTGTPRAAADVGRDRREEQRPRDRGDAGDDDARAISRRDLASGARVRLKIDPNSVRAAIAPFAAARAAVEEVRGTARRGRAPRRRRRRSRRRRRGAGRRARRRGARRRSSRRRGRSAGRCPASAAASTPVNATWLSASPGEHLRAQHDEVADRARGERDRRAGEERVADELLREHQRSRRRAPTRRARRPRSASEVTKKPTG